MAKAKLMTVAELRAIPPFDVLPFRSVKDEEGCDKLERPNSPAWQGVIAEASTEEQVTKLLDNKQYEAVGAIIYEDEDPVHVRAIFWQRRQPN